MENEDDEKTKFITKEGAFCYTVMPFRLKNAGVTFRWLMYKILKGQIGRNIEVYVDDIFVRSKEEKDHLVDLEETLGNIRKAGLCLKEKKAHMLPKDNF